MFDKLKQLSKDTAIYGISTMLVRFLNFVLVPFYTHVYLPEEYGVISNVYAFIALMNIFYIYGMDSGYLRFASSKEVGDDKDNFSTPFLSVFITAIVFSIIIYKFRHPVELSFSIAAKYSYVIYYIISILFFDVISILPFIKLRLDRKAKTFALFKTLNIVLNVILNIILILILHWGIEAVFLSNLVASIFSFVLLIPLIKKNFKFSIHKELYKRLLRFGLPYFPAGLGAMMIQVIDRPIMQHLTNLKTLGIYQANYKLGIFMMLFVNMFQYAWQPFFMQEAKTDNAKEIFSKVLTYFTLTGSIILVLLSLFISDIVTFHVFGKTIMGRAYLSGLYIVPVVLLGYLFNGMYVVFTAGIYIKEKSVYVPFITGLGAVINVGVNFLLIPYLGMMGAALATLAAYLSMAIGFYIFTQKIYKIEYENSRIIKIFLLIIIIGAVYYGLLFSNNLIFIYKILLLIFFIVTTYFFVVEKEEINFVVSKFRKKYKV